LEDATMRVLFTYHPAGSREFPAGTSYYSANLYVEIQWRDRPWTAEDELDIWFDQQISARMAPGDPARLLEIDAERDDPPEWPRVPDLLGPTLWAAARYVVDNQLVEHYVEVDEVELMQQSHAWRELWQDAPLLKRIPESPELLEEQVRIVTSDPALNRRIIERLFEAEDPDDDAHPSQ
jgi:hypothetical protein